MRTLRVLSLSATIMIALLAAATCSSDPAETVGPAGVGGGSGGESPCPTEPDIDTTPPPDPGAATAPPVIDCGTPTFADGTPLRRKPYLQSITPTSARIAWTGTADSATLRWAASAAGPWTEVTATAELFDTARTGDTESYHAFDVTLEGLQPSQSYCYEVLIDGEVAASGLGFHSAWQDETRPVHVLAFGDSGALTPEQAALRDVFMMHDHDVLLHLGDMAYGEGTFVQFEERVFDMYADLMHRVPSYPTIGNHEYKTDRAQPYLDVYYLFEQAWREDDQERYYSFDYGNAHFISLDSNDEMLIPIALDVAGAAEDDMIDWLRDDLAKSDATWKIAFFHHPPFSLYDSRSDNARVISQILPALGEGGVDLILVGHDHHYVRTLPVRGDCKVPGGEGAIPFILVGSGGTGLHPIEDDEDWYVDYANDQVHAFLSLTLHGCEGRGQAIDLNGNVIDSFVLNGCLE